MISFDDEDDLERIELYRLFASLFMSPPDVATLERVEELFDLEINDTYLEIEDDFMRLFSEESGVIPPYESLYNYPVGDAPRVHGRVTDEVSSVYISAGLVMDDDMDMVPDHLCVELIFSGYLVQAGQERQLMVFLEEHLGQWVYDWCEEIDREAGTVFYKDVAGLLKGFLESEHNELQKRMELE